MYDLVIVTHLPSFYKVRLYNEISKKLKVFVIFVGKSSVQRTTDFLEFDTEFDSITLSPGAFETRKILSSFLCLYNILRNLQFSRLLVSGWDLPEYWFLAFIIRKKKLSLALESTILESKATGFSAMIKRLFLSRISTVLASGSLHEKLLKALNYQGEVVITKGVGLIKKHSVFSPERIYQKKFLFLGRLAPEKNLITAIQVFNELPEFELTIAGNGPSLTELSKVAKTNVSFLSHVPNEKVFELISNHDFLLLPSSREPWGLVIEESLYCGRPVIISSNCGSVDLVKDGINGYIFNPHSPLELKSILMTINDEKFQKLIGNISQEYIDEKDRDQVKAYLEL